MRKIAVPLVALALLAGACKGDAPSTAAAGASTTTTTIIDGAPASDGSATTLAGGAGGGGGSKTTTTKAGAKAGGGSGTPAVNGDGTLTADPAPEATQSGDLKAKLITVADIPPGFTVTEDTGDDGSDDLSGCAPADAVDAKYKGKYEEVGVDFEKGSAGGYALLGSVLDRYASSPVANTAFDEQASSFDKCQSFTTKDDDGNELHITLSPMSFPRMGDDTFARKMHVETESDGVPIQLDGALIAIRHGRIHASITVIGTGPVMPTTEDLEAITRKALAKI